MFYPVKFLKPGGKFHLTWLADCIPKKLYKKKYYTILLVTDIRKLCDELMEVVVTESGLSSHRFSLKLSSQLLRGLVRLYDRKINLYLEHTFTFLANLWKRSNMITESDEDHERRKNRSPRVRRVVPPTRAVLIEAMQNNTNVVANADEITIREENIPPRQLPVDGFGEEPQDVNIDALELMRAPETSLQHHSVMELNVGDVTENTRDNTRMMQPQMEGIQEVDVTMFKRSMGVDELPLDMQPEIPPIHDILPVPINNLQEISKEIEPEQMELEKTVEFNLEELEAVDSRRRKKKHPISDQVIMISGNQMRKRLENYFIEYRCKGFKQDKVKTDKIPVDILLRGSAVVNSGLSFRRVVNFCEPLAEELKEFFKRVPHLPEISTLNDELEEMVRYPRQRPALQPIIENEILEDIPQVPMPVDHEMLDLTRLQNISDLPTQLIPELQGIPYARPSEPPGSVLEEISINKPVLRSEFEPPAKRSCVRESVHPKKSADTVRSTDQSKENIPYNPAEANVLAHLPPLEIEEIPQIESIVEDPHRTSHRESQRRTQYDSSEQLGSLDRTKVSLESHNEETAIKKYLNEEWGSKATYEKIVKARGRNPEEPIDVHNLVKRCTNSNLSNTPPRFMAAKCFISLLKLHQHGYIKMEKDPSTSELIDVYIVD